MVSIVYYDHYYALVGTTHMYLRGGVWCVQLEGICSRLAHVVIDVRDKF